MVTYSGGPRRNGLEARELGPPTAMDLARHHEGPAGLGAVMAALSEARPVWIMGGPGRGKTHLLRVLHAALTFPDEAARRGLPPPTGDGARWLMIAVDAAPPVAGESLLAQAVHAFAAEARRKLGRALETTPASEWLTWIDRGPGQVLRDLLEDAVQERLGRSLAEARRVDGADVVATLVRELAAAHGFGLPAMVGMREKLAWLYDQLGDVGPLRVVLAIDNAGARGVDPELDELIQAAGDVASVYGQPWQVVATSADAPPALASAPVAVELPRLDTAVVATATGLDLDEVEPEVWRALEELLQLTTSPLALAAEVLAERTAVLGRPPTFADLQASAPLQRLLASRCPPPDGDEEAWLASWLRCHSDGAWGEATPLEPVDLQLCREVATALTSAGRRSRIAERDLVLGELAASTPERLTWENVVYRGEVLCAPQFDAEWGQPLPPDAAFRMVLITRPAPVAAEALRDPRLVVLLPAVCSPPEQDWLAWRAALRAVAERGDGTLSERARRWLAVDAENARAWAEHAYSDGRVVARPPAVGQRLREGGGPATWPGTLLRRRFGALHERRSEWVDAEALDEPLTEDALATVWRDLAAQVAHTGLLAALHLARDQRPPGEAMLWEMIELRGGAVAVPELMARLTDAPFGLTPDLVKLHLLALVLRHGDSLQLEVSGLAAAPVALSAAEVRRLEWRDLRPGQLRRLVRGDTRTWEEMLPVLRELVPELSDEATPGAVQSGRDRLRAALANLSGDVAEVSRGVRELARGTEQPVPEAVRRALPALAEIAATTSAEACDNAVLRQFALDREAWRAALAALRRWRQVVQAGPDLLALHRYLLATRLPPEHLLEGELLALRAQIDIERLLANPHLVPALLARGDAFRRRYAAVYRDAHAEHQQRLAALRDGWDETGRVWSALRRLNEIEALGLPAEADTGLEWRLLEPLLRTCPVTPDVRYQPVCDACGWTLGTQAPAERVQAVRGRITDAFERRSRRLRAALTDEILARLGDDRLEALHHVLTLQQAASLPEVLTPETVDLLARHLGDGGLGAGDLLRALSERFAYVDADNLPAVLQVAEQLLREAIERDERVWLRPADEE